MTPDRWAKVEEIYHDALDRDSGARVAFVQEACFGDEELRREVESLLAQKTGDLLNEPAAKLADQVASLNGKPTVGSLIGEQLSTYKILAKIGEGGMGVVYRARDTKLGRDVAIKLLPPEVVNDPERLSRFRREAKMLASLNHPNIAAIYGLEEVNRTNFVVMELAEGKTLADRLRTRAMPVKEALTIGVQVAEALAHAHQRKIIHRDLKPANVVLTAEGRIKVLDFGLAKALTDESADASEGSTVSLLPTEIGRIMGTPAYMSPEQAQGKPVDQQTDIWAFGCLLYELLAGERAFTGENISQTIAAVLHNEPDWKALSADTPPQFRALLRRCLQKDPTRRLHSAADLAIEIEDSLIELSEKRLAVSSATAELRKSRVWPYVAGVLFAALAALLIFVVRLRPVAPTGGAYSFRPFATEATEENHPSWSPDGKSIAYFAEIDGVKQIFTKSLDATAPSQITKSLRDCIDPFWSPDGTRIYYRATTPEELWSIGAAGGEPHRIIENVQAVDIAPDGRFAFVRGLGGNMSLWISSSANPEAPVKYKQAPFPEEFARSWTIGFSRDGSKLAILMARAEPAGFITELWVVPFPSGAPRKVFDSLPFQISMSARISWLPDNRRLVLDAIMPGIPGNHLYLFDTDHKTSDLLTPGSGNEWAASVSADGSKIAFSTGKIDFDILQIPLDGSSATHTVLGTSSEEMYPAWSPTGLEIAYLTDARGSPELWTRSLRDRWAIPILTRTAEGLPLWDSLERPSFSPDGSRIAFGAYGSRHTIWISPARGGRPVPLDADSYDQHGAAWSPDGNWIAYQRFYQGTWKLVKVPVSGGTPVPLAESAAGGGDTAWSPTGDWLAFRSAGSLQLVSPASKEQKVLSKSRPAAFGFSKDGSLVYLVRHRPNQTWELVAVAVRNGTEHKIADLSLPPSATVAGFSLNPDGRSFITSVGTPKFDIWLLEGLKGTH